MTWPGDGKPAGSLAEAINGHLAFVRKAHSAPVTEDELTFHCFRGGHRLAALDANVQRRGKRRLRGGTTSTSASHDRIEPAPRCGPMTPDRVGP
jgi:hypothetical protein